MPGLLDYWTTGVQPVVRDDPIAAFEWVPSIRLSTRLMIIWS